MTTTGEETGAKAPTGGFARAYAALRRGLAGAFGRGRVVALIALVLLVGLRMQDPEAVQLTRYATLDAFQKLSPREPENSHIAIVDIDEASIAELGQWPWSRADLARMVDAMATGGPRAIGFDVVFSEPDRLSPDLLAGTLDGLPPIARGLLSQLPSTDARFAESIARAPVVLGMSGLAAPELAAGAIATTGAPATPLRAFGGDPTFQLFAFPGQLRNVPTLETAASGIGMFSLTPEHDGVVRRVPAALRIGETAYPSLAVEMLRIGAGANGFGLVTGPHGVEAALAGGFRAPTDPNGRFWLHTAPHDPSLYVSAADIIAGRVDPSVFTDKYVLIGSSAVGLRDLRRSALGEVIPGVEIHAQIIDSVLTDALPVRPAGAMALEHGLAVLGALLVIAVTPALAAARALPLFLGVSAALWGGTFYVFAVEGVVLDASYPFAVWGLLFFGLAYAGYSRAEAQRKQIRSAFSSYLSPDLVEQLAERPETLRLGGESREMTFLFCDLAGFTAFVEKAEPETLVRLLNEYLDGVCSVVMKHGGTIDKIVGDAVHAMFNAPLDEPRHAEKAVLCALEIEAFVTRFREEKRAEGHEFGATRIGVNTGRVIVGNFGGARRLDYTAHGDAINTAARLEGANKYLGTTICVSGSAAEQCSDAVAFRPIGRLMLKGKEGGVPTFEPIRAGETASSDYARAFALMEAGKPDAKAAFDVLVESLPGDPLAALHAARLREGAVDATIVMSGK